MTKVYDILYKEFSTWARSYRSIPSADMTFNAAMFMANAILIKYPEVREYEIDDLVSCCKEYLT